MTDERRIDHFAYLKGAPQAPLPDADQPTVRPDLVEYLEKQFPIGVLPRRFGLDGAIDQASEVARMNGEQRVIEAIRQLIRGA